MKLFLIRHGQTDWNVKGRIQGSYDSELNATGILQAKDLGEKILELDYKFAKIYSSPGRRAAKTAEILSGITKVEYLSIDGLREVNFGDWEGLTWNEVKEKHPEEFGVWYNNRRYTKIPNGETYQEMLERVLIEINKIIGENSEDVAIVTHSAVIMGLQCYITNTPFEKMMTFRIENSSIMEIDSEAFLLD
ncbi:histidine phosphatase family protein [Clostridium sp. DL1XJH146]